MIKFTQGDTVTIEFYAEDSNGLRIDLSGATFSTQIKGYRGSIVTIDNSSHTADPDQVTNKGKFTVSLTSAQTLLMDSGDKKDIVTKIVQGASTIHYHGKGILEIFKNYPAS